MRRKIIYLALAAALLLCACNNKKDEKIAASDVSEPVMSVENAGSGSAEINLSMRPPSSLNPLLNEDETIDTVLRLIYEPLIAIDSSFKPVANIAESWYFTNEGKTISLKLKSGLSWHNGKPITADDVIYSVNVIKGASDKAVYKSCTEGIVDAIKTGSDTVEISFAEAFYGNIYSLTFPLIASDGNADINIFESSKTMAKPGNGAYDFEAYSAAKEIVLSKAISCTGKNALTENIKIIISKDEATDLYYFKNSITDALYDPLGSYNGTELPVRVSEYSYDTLNFDFLGFNFNNGILKDKNVRKAIAYSVPKENIRETVYSSGAEIAYTPINPVSWLYEDDTLKYQYDLNEAKKLLESAGWKLSETGKSRTKTENGTTVNLALSILVNAENEQRRQCAKRIADELSSIGFDITVTEVSFSDYSKLIAEGSFDILLGGLNLSYESDLGELFGSTNNNIINYGNEEMDGYINSLYTAVGETEIKKAYSDIQKYIAEELPYVSLAFKKGKLYTGGNIEGGGESSAVWVYSGLYNWVKK